MTAAQSKPEPPPERSFHVNEKLKWSPSYKYLVRLALDGRKRPNDSRRGRKVDYLHAGQWVAIKCQIRLFDEHTGAPGRLYDKVGKYYVPTSSSERSTGGASPARPRANGSSPAWRRSNKVGPLCVFGSERMDGKCPSATPTQGVTA